MLGGGPITQNLATPLVPKIKTTIRDEILKMKTYGLFHITRIQMEPESNDYMDIHILAVRK